MLSYQPMNLEEAIKFADAAIFRLANRHLSAPEVTILQGTWQGMTYDQMAENSQYSLNYLMRDIGPRFWRLLSEALGEEVSKTNFRNTIERQFYGATDRSETRSHFADIPDEGSEIPTPTAFFDRVEELTTLKDWIDRGCRLIAIRGASGIGKTALARQLVEAIEERFDCTIWRSFSQAPTIDELCNDIHKLCRMPNLPGENDAIAKLINCLRSSRCLLVFDGIETILQSGQLVGSYREGYEEYGKLFRRVGEELHPSCLAITTLENPREIGLLAGETTPVRSLVLSGLPSAYAQEILESEGLSDRNSWQTLVERYRGNPAALKLASKLIRDLFNGNASELIERDALVLGDINKLVESTIARLSAVEKELLYWLAMERKPISFANLEANLNLSISQGELIETLASLGQRSLIETTTSQSGRSLFALAPMVMEYVTSEIVEQISGKDSYRQNELRDRWHPFEHTIELTPSPQQPIDLSNWFDYRFEATWLPIEALLADAKTSPRLRSIYYLRGEGTIKRFKPIQLPDDRYEIAFIMAIEREAERKVGIRVQVQPMGEVKELPSGLKLALLNESGQILREVQAQSQDNFIQLPRFRGNAQERFSIQISQKTFSVKEDFVI